jgi:hypothetical protein
MFKEFFTDISEDAKTAWHFAFRNIFWIALGILAYWGLGSLTEMRTVILTIVLIESLALGFSGIGAYVFSKMNFTKDTPIILGFIFLGVHILVGLVTLLVYFTNFATKV